MSTYMLPVSTPASQGVAADGILSFLDALEALPEADPHSLMILRHGQVIASGWWRPYTPERRHLLYSLSKSFTSTAALLAIADGLLQLDDPVIAHFPELDAEITLARARSMLVRHVAAMASGHLGETWEQVLSSDPDEPIRGFLQLPPEREPGTVFAYNQSATYTLAAIVQRRTGQTLVEYLRQRLGEALGAGEVSWRQHPVGRDIGFSGLFATTDTVARLGQLYLQRGKWRGNQLLAEDLVADATRPHISTRSRLNGAGEPEPDWQEGYGFQFWMSRHGYRGDGAYGQFCVVLPEYDAVVAMTAQTDDMQAVLDVMWDKLLPAFDATDRDADAGTVLERRLEHLAVRSFEGRFAPFNDDEVWTRGTFLPVRGACEQQESLLAVKLAREEDGWRVTFSEADWTMNAGFRNDKWVVTEPVSRCDGVPTACVGGWLDGSTLRLDVVFLETPHRLVVTCRLPERTFGARWKSVPLHTLSLRDLRA